MSEVSEEDRHTLSIQIANQVINIANTRLEEGLDPIDKLMTQEDPDGFRVIE